MKLYLSLLFCGMFSLASGQTGAQKIRQQEIKDSYLLAMNAVQDQQRNIDPTMHLHATVKRTEAGVGQVTYNNEFYTTLPEQMSFFRCKRVQGVASTKHIEALFNNNRIIFFLEKEGSHETRIYWNNDGSLCMTLEKTSANSTTAIDKLDHKFVSDAKEYAERENNIYTKVLDSGRYKED